MKTFHPFNSLLLVSTGSCSCTEPDSSETSDKSLADTAHNNDISQAARFQAGDISRAKTSTHQTRVADATSRYDDVMFRDHTAEGPVSLPQFPGGGMFEDREEEEEEMEGRDERKVKRNRTTFSTRQLQVSRWRGMSEVDDGGGD